MQRLLKAAQARKLDRVAAVYAVAGWILVQGASILLPTFDAPVWALRVFVIVVLLGFPIALAVAWTVAPHPHPGKRGTPVSTTHTDMALLALLGAVVLLSVGQFAYQFSHQAAAPLTSTAAPGATAPAPNEASIAVLPFVNMSGDPSKEYFSDGISEELLNDLSNVPDLRVAARTSSFAFKGKTENIQKIASVLHVRAVVEGSVREEGNRVRITAQLIDAGDGYHLWSQTYNGDLTDILAAQENFARAITSALTNRLLGKSEVPSGKPSSIDPEAYRKYLEGQYDFATRTKEGIAKAIDLFKQVTVLQPDFADGFAALAHAYFTNITIEAYAERNEHTALAAAAVAEALRLDQNNLEALFLHMSVALSQWDWETAAVDVHRMQAINPNNASVLFGLYWYYERLGVPEQSSAMVRQAIELDPLSVVLKISLSDTLIRRGHPEEGKSVAEAALALQPGNPFALRFLCEADAGLGNFESAQRTMAQLATVEPAWFAKECAFNIAIKSSQIAEARKLADELAAGFPNLVPSAAMIADEYFKLGNFEKAIDWLERACDQKEYNLWLGLDDKEIAALRGTSRGKALWQRPLMKEWQAAHDRVAAELAAGK